MSAPPPAAAGRRPDPWLNTPGDGTVATGPTDGLPVSRRHNAHISLRHMGHVRKRHRNDISRRQTSHISFHHRGRISRSQQGFNRHHRDQEQQSAPQRSLRSRSRASASRSRSQAVTSRSLAVAPPRSPVTSLPSRSLAFAVSAAAQVRRSPDPAAEVWQLNVFNSTYH